MNEKKQIFTDWDPLAMNKYIFIISNHPRLTVTWKQVSPRPASFSRKAYRGDDRSSLTAAPARGH